MNVLESKQVEAKRVNMVSEISSPSKKNIFREMSNVHILTCYYDVNILKYLYLLKKNDINLTNFYINIYQMNNEFSQQILQLFCNLLYTLTVGLDLTYDILLFPFLKEGVIRRDG